MAIAFGAVGAAASQTAVSPLNLTGPTVSGSDTIGFCVAYGGDTADVVTGITWGGSAMTFIAKILTNNNHYSYLYYILNPSSGATVEITYSGGSHFMSGGTIYYTGAQQSGQPDANTTTETPNTALTSTLTTIADNCWLVSVIACDSGIAATAGTGTIIRTGTGISWDIFDSNGARSIGSNSIIATLPIEGGNAVTASFAPATSLANLKTWNGLAKASVKTINGLAIASVKTWNGLS